MSEISIRQSLFLCFGIVLIVSALGVVFHRNPLKSALFLIAFFVGLASLYALLGAEALATLQIMVYVGAIMVLFLFVIMLISIQEENFESPLYNVGRLGMVSALVLTFIFQIILLLQVPQGKANIDPLRDPQVTLASGVMNADAPQGVAINLFQRYLIPFELISFVLLVALVGAVMLAKKNRNSLE